MLIGKEAPDIVGAKFNLSDQRGKGVSLVFWASWRRPCMTEIPHQKELIDHFGSRPSALIGVNGNENRQAAKAAGPKHAMSWRSFWSGEKGAGGAIANSWNVHSWPTVCVIDSKGIIRHKHLRGKRLDEPLERLVAETEAARR